MNTFKQLEEIREAHRIIKNGNSGNSIEFSRKLYVSERKFFKILKELKGMGAPVKYDKFLKKYYYDGPFDLIVSFSICVLIKDELKLIYGGNSFKNINSIQTVCFMQ